MELTIGTSDMSSPPAGDHTFNPVAGRPVDLVHLARYTLGNASHEREVLALFRTQSGICLNRLAHAAHATAWREAAHTIKDSARDIGAWRVARTAEDAEALDGDALTQRRVDILEALQRDVGEANGYIRILLADA